MESQGIKTVRVQRRAVYVWELPVRLFHWINALAITILFITGMYIGHPVLSSPGEATLNFFMGKIRLWHTVAAFSLIANMLVRIYWFWRGNDYSKLKIWSRFFRQDLWRTIKYYTFRSQEHYTHLGHNALAQLMYIIFIWLIGFLMILTGLAMRGGGNPNGIWQALFGWVFPAFRGEYQVRNLHHLLAWGYPLFVVGHLYMVFRQDIMDDDGTASSMISGFKYELQSSHPQEPEKGEAVPVAGK